MKFKVGDKVELLYGGNEWPLIGYKNGEIYTVTKFPKVVIENHIKNGLIPITGGHQKYGYAKPEQLKLVEPKKTKNQRITELEKQVANLLERVEALEKHRLIAKEEKTPNQQRAEIIEKAKRFVEETTKRQATFTLNKIGNRTYRQFRTKNEFVINAKKRTVVVLVKGVTNGKLFEKGISKCHPQDVFNEHIGKAIALGRALGLDVSEFEQAVQPTEIVIGMKVNINSMFGQRNNETILGFENYGILVNRFCGNRLDGRTWLSKNSVEKIIDDTNAIYE